MRSGNDTADSMVHEGMKAGCGKVESGRAGVVSAETTPALWASPPDLGGECLYPRHSGLLQVAANLNLPLLHRSHGAKALESQSRDSVPVLPSSCCLQRVCPYPG